MRGQRGHVGGKLHVSWGARCTEIIIVDRSCRDVFSSLRLCCRAFMRVCFLRLSCFLQNCSFGFSSKVKTCEDVFTDALMMIRLTFVSGIQLTLDYGPLTFSTAFDSFTHYSQIGFTPVKIDTSTSSTSYPHFSI